MKKKVAFWLILGSLSMICCTNSQSLKEIQESKADSLSLQKVTNIELWCSDKMTICDSCLVIIDRCQKEKLYFFQLKDFKFLKSAGNTGQGPTDFIFPFFLENTPLSSSELSIYDTNLSKLKVLNINHLLNNMAEFLIRETTIPATILGSTDMAQITNNYYGSKDVGLGMFFIYSPSNNAMEWIPYPPSVSNKQKEIDLNINQNRITVHPQKKLIATAMRFYNQIFLYDSNGKLLKSGTFGKEIKPKIENNKISVLSDMFFTQIYSTEKYIYLVLTNQKYKDKRPSSLKPSKIVILDWNLNHIKTLYTDKRIHSIAVDSLYNRLLILGIDDEENPELYYSNWSETIKP